MSDAWVPVVSAVLGAVFGALSSLVVNALRHEQLIASRLIEHYFTARGEIAQAIAELADLDLDEPLDTKGLRRKVSRLYYQHYDVLPAPLIEDLLLLHVSIVQANGRLYEVRAGEVVPLREHKAIAEFIDSCSIFKTAGWFAALALGCASDEVKARQAIKLHARRVLQALNRYSSVDDLITLTKRLKKMR